MRRDERVVGSGAECAGRARPYRLPGVAQRMADRAPRVLADGEVIDSARQARALSSTRRIRRTAGTPA